MDGYMDVSHVNVVRCERPIPRTEWSYRIHVFVCVSVSVIRHNYNPQHLKCVGRRDRNKKERRKKHSNKDATDIAKLANCTLTLHHLQCKMIKTKFL